MHSFIQKLWFKFIHKRFKLKNYKSQLPMPFPSTLNYYILTKIKEHPIALKKLTLTCKFWFLQYKILFIDDLHMRVSYSSLEFKMWINTNFVQGSEVLKRIPPLNLWLIDKAWFIGKNKLADPHPRDFMLPLFLKINQCFLKELSLSLQNFIFDDYIFLTSNGTIKSLIITECNISYNDGSIVYIEELLPNVPNCIEFKVNLPNGHVSLQTPQKLLKIKRSVKFKEIWFGAIPFDFDYDTFLEFVRINAAWNTSVKITMDDFRNVPQPYKENVKTTIKNVMRTWEPGYQSIQIELFAYFDAYADIIIEGNFRGFCCPLNFDHPHRRKRKTPLTMRQKIVQRISNLRR